ncbi:MAG TPA: alpha/beta hydrolase [Longimicrobiaceae bacterium]|nr:alpha/beta hydrolase [Longimicrobiaceae bacterium]
MSRALLALAALALVLAGCARLRTPAGGAAREARGGGYLQGTGGVRLYYRMVGDGPDTVVVVHGGPGAGMNTILPDLAPLARSHTLIYYDQRGGGRSELPRDTTLLDASFHVQDLEAVRRFFGLERMSVVAHSFGPILVARYLAEHPGRVARMVFLGSSPPRRADAGEIARSSYARSDPAAVRRYIELIQALGTDTVTEVMERCREFEALGRTLSLSRGEPAGHRGTSCAMPPEAVRYYFRYTARVTPSTLGDWDFTTRWITPDSVPLLVVHGNADPLALAAQQRWGLAVPNTRVLAVPGAGKGAHADRPDVVFPAIGAFLRGEWPQGAQPAVQ